MYVYLFGPDGVRRPLEAREGRTFLPATVSGEVALRVVSLISPHVWTVTVQAPLHEDANVYLDLPRRLLTVTFETEDGSPVALPLTVGHEFGTSHAATAEARRVEAFWGFEWRPGEGLGQQPLTELSEATLRIERPDGSRVVLFAQDTRGRSATVAIPAEAMQFSVRLRDVHGVFRVNYAGAPAKGFLLRGLSLGCTAPGWRAVVGEDGYARVPGFTGSWAPTLLLFDKDDATEPVSVRSFLGMEEWGRLRLASRPEGVDLDFPSGEPTSYHLVGGIDSTAVGRIRLSVLNAGGTRTPVRSVLPANDEVVLPAWVADSAIVAEASIGGQWVPLHVDAVSHALSMPEVVVVKGRVLSAMDKTPIAGAVVEWGTTAANGKRLRQSPREALPVRPDGTFTLIVPRAAGAWVLARAEGWSVALQTLVDLQPDAADFLLEPSRSLRIVAEPQSEFAGARVLLTPINGAEYDVIEGLTDGEGAYVASLPAKSRYQVIIRSAAGRVMSAAESRAPRAEIVVRAARGIVQEIRLAPELAVRATRLTVDWDGLSLSQDIWGPASPVQILVPEASTKGAIVALREDVVLLAWRGESSQLPPILEIDPDAKDVIELVSSNAEGLFGIRDPRSSFGATAYVERGATARVAVPRNSQAWRIGPADGVASLFQSPVRRIYLDDLLVDGELVWEDGLEEARSSTWRLETGDVRLESTNERRVLKGFRGGETSGSLVTTGADGRERKEAVRLVERSGRWVVERAR